MFFIPKIGLQEQAALAALLNQLRALFDAMDRHYEKVAHEYGFHCDGCAENCCETRFYHYTIIEFLYLEEGMKTLTPEPATTVYERAAQVAMQTRAADKAGQKIRLMCPLNRHQRCLVYPYRPMICRLHGIPHELHPQQGRIVKGEGCRQFDLCAKEKPYIQFDRTPFYKEMAHLEQQARNLTGFSDKIKMTIAEMLMAQNRKSVSGEADP